MIFDTGFMKDLFLNVVKRARTKYDFHVDNFCIMGNHFHLMIRPGKGMNLSAIMQWIMSVFAMAFNRMKGYTGHVWGSRFFSHVVSGFKEFLEVFKYIDNNPVKACQVEDPLKWRHGGLWHDRAGLKHIIDQAALIQLVFPEHGQLLLGDR